MRRIALLFLIFVVVVADQWTKAIARLILVPGEPLAVGPLAFMITKNRGAFLSLGSNLPAHLRVTIFDVLVSIVLVVAATILFRGMLSRMSERIAVALLIGGGIGNLIDRVRFRGLVTDFMVLSAGPLHTGVFNIADTAITTGVIWLVASWIVERRHGRHVV